MFTRTHVRLRRALARALRRVKPHADSRLPADVQHGIDCMAVADALVDLDPRRSDTHEFMSATGTPGWGPIPPPDEQGGDAP